jgi:hypothetical protein
MLSVKCANLRGVLRQAALASGMGVCLERERSPAQLARSLGSLSRSRSKKCIGSSVAKLCRVCGCRPSTRCDQGPSPQPSGPQPPVGGSHGRSWGGGGGRFAHMAAFTAPVRAPSNSEEDVILLDVGGMVSSPCPGTTLNVPKKYTCLVLQSHSGCALRIMQEFVYIGDISCALFLEAGDSMSPGSHLA